MHLLNPNVNLVLAMPGQQKVVPRYLNEQERLNLARLLVKNIDQYSYKMHCKNGSCACVMKETNGSSDDEDEDNLPSYEFLSHFMP